VQPFVPLGDYLNCFLQLDGFGRLLVEFNSRLHCHFAIAEPFDQDKYLALGLQSNT
jgi:hypothetical protein